MKVYRDKYKNIYTDLDYCDDHSDLEQLTWVQEKENFHVDHEDFVASVPGSMTLCELDKNLEEFQMFSNIYAPKDYSISKILAEFHDRYLLKKVLGLNLTHPNETITQAGSMVIKDVSGYDMKKLYIGSFNSFALIANSFLKLEKRFEDEYIFQFRMRKSLSQLLKLRNFLQSFLDHRIEMKVFYNKALDDFCVQIKSSESAKILECRHRSISSFINSELELSSALQIKKEKFVPAYKDEKRIEVDFDFSNIEKIFGALNEDALIEPLLGVIILNDYKDLSNILEYVSNVKVFPVTLFNRKLVRTITVNSDETKILHKLKQLYDHKGQLNPGVLQNE